MFQVMGIVHKSLTPSDRKTLTLYRQEYIIRTRDEPINRSSTLSRFVKLPQHTKGILQICDTNRRNINQYDKNKETERSTSNQHNTHIKCSL